MATITGIGGFFFKTPDPKATARWFTEVLGLPTESWGRVFQSDEKSSTVLGLHAATSDYYGPSPLPFMLNLRVDDLDGMLETLRAKGVTVIKVLDPDPQGRFAHIAGPDGLTIELWEPAKDA